MAAATGGGTQAVDRLAGFHRLLSEVAIPRGYLGPRELDRLVDRHILQSAALVPLLGRGEGPVVDVGAGAGVPGIVLACLDAGPLLLVEAETRRSRFLQSVVDELGLDAAVVTGRAEELAHDPRYRETARAGTARALGPPPVALELVVPFVRPGGVVALVVGESANARDSTKAAELLGGEPPEVRPAQVPGSDATCRVMIVKKGAVTPSRYPRRTGVPARRPLGSER